MEQLLAVPAKRIQNSTNLVSISERAVDIHTGCDWSAAGLEMGPGDRTGKNRLYRRTKSPLSLPGIVFVPFPVPGHLLSVQHLVQIPPAFLANWQPWTAS